jgi:hypothetical protein
MATRWQRGTVAIGIGMVLFFASSAISVAAQTTAPASENLTWTQWLQAVVNAMKVLELGTFVFSAYQFWAGRRDRNAADVEQAVRARIDSNYQAWQVINSAQGKGGSGGRVEALADLLGNGISLAGINLDGAWLEDVQLPHASLKSSSLRNANFSRANLRGANLESADLTGATFVAANLTGAYLRGAILTGVRLSAATLDGADLAEAVGWREIRSISHTSIQGLKRPPAGFIAFARQEGAVDDVTKAEPPDEDDGFSRAFRAI